MGGGAVGRVGWWAQRAGRGGEGSRTRTEETSPLWPHPKATSTRRPIVAARVTIKVLSRKEILGPVAINRAIAACAGILTVKRMVQGCGRARHCA